MASIERMNSHYTASTVSTAFLSPRIGSVYCRNSKARSLGDLKSSREALTPHCVSNSNNASPINGVSSKASYLRVTNHDVDEKRVVTKFVAETLLPTKYGKFRLRGYKHSVRVNPSVC
jgi:hypothetical protein